MKKINKKISVWIMVGVFALGTGQAMIDDPIYVQAAEEKTAEKVQASDYVLTPQKSYSFADMGLSFELPKMLLKKMKNKEIAMLPEAEISEDGNSLKYGLISWSTMTEEQRKAEVGADGSGYTEWVDSLGLIGCLGVYQKNLEKDLDKLTGCTEHEKIGTSEDGEYSYYLSINQEAEDSLAKELGKIKTEIIQMIYYGGSGMSEGDSIGSFTTEDINGEEYTEKIFQEADLTMVNVFATWCGPCVKEIPYLAELDKKMEDKGVQIVGIVMDAVNGNKKDEEGIKKAQILEKQTKAEYLFLLPDSGYMNGRLSYVQAFPETFFVDKNGNITGETYSGSRSLEEWEEIVNAELEKLQSKQEAE